MAHTEERKKRERVSICIAKIGSDSLIGKDSFIKER